MIKRVKYLIKKGANPNAETNQKWTALMFAAHKGHLEILKTLLKHGARIDFQNNLGMSSNMYAAQNGHLEIVKLLLKKGSLSSLLPYVSAAKELVMSAIELDTDLPEEWE